MKLAIIGGGSTYSPELIHGLSERSLGIDAISLMDISAERLQIVGGFVRRMAPSLRIETTTDPDAAIDGADFVVTQIRAGGQSARLEAADAVLGDELVVYAGLADFRSRRDNRSDAVVRVLVDSVPAATVTLGNDSGWVRLPAVATTRKTASAP